MDLNTYEQGTWILHLIDLFSRYSTACVRRSKKQSVMIDAVLKTWISYFGRPKRFLADNEGEFLNEEYKEMCEMFNIKEVKTAAERPWSNRVCEYQNAILKESVRKTIDESRFKLETAVVWAASAKNSLRSHQGYSPNTLVFGRNRNYPNVLTNNPPALETEVSSITVAENLKAMNNARNAFIQDECSEKIKRALRHKISSCNDSFFENGDKVYYKQNNPKWKGPGCVIDQEGKSVLVKHGSEYVRVHPASLVHADTANPTTKSEKEPVPIIEKCELTPTVKEEEEISEQEYSGAVEGEKHTNNASDQQMDVHTEPALGLSMQNDKIKLLKNMTLPTNQVKLPTIKSRITDTTRAMTFKREWFIVMQEKQVANTNTT